MKLVLIIEDESWFWIYNEETQIWEAWYEEGDEPAKRRPAEDYGNLLNLVDWMSCRARDHEWEIVNANDASLSK